MKRLTPIYINVSPAERDLVRSLAEREGLTISQWVRFCINDRLARDGASVPLLKSREWGKRPALPSGAEAKAEPVLDGALAEVRLRLANALADGDAMEGPRLAMLSWVDLAAEIEERLANCI